MSDIDSQAARAALIFPEELKIPLLTACEAFSGEIYELRLYKNAGICLNTSEGLRFLTVSGRLTIGRDSPLLLPTGIQLKEIFSKAVDFSPYVHQKEIEDGFVTFRGFRMGITMQSDGEVRTLNIRIPLEKPPVLDSRVAAIFSDSLHSVLFAGAPASGKTTVLRSLIGYLTGSENSFYFNRISVIDERGELFEGGIESKYTAYPEDNEVAVSAAKIIEDLSGTIKKESDIESLVTAKTGSECVAVISENAVDIIVSTASLSENNVLQITDIVSQVCGNTYENIKISGTGS